jgi:hypothetical protein
MIYSVVVGDDDVYLRLLGPTASQANIAFGRYFTSKIYVSRLPSTCPTEVMLSG